MPSQSSNARHLSVGAIAYGMRVRARFSAAIFYTFCFLVLAGPLALGQPIAREREVRPERPETPHVDPYSVSSTDLMRARNLFFGTRSGGHKPSQAGKFGHSFGSKEPVSVHLPDLTSIDHYQSENVRWLQQSINRVNGRGLAADGKFSDSTKGALRDLQQQYGLPPSGTVDAETEDLLEALTSTTAPSRFDFLEALRGSTLPERPLSRSATPAERAIQDKMVFLDVKHQNGRVTVAVSQGTNYLSMAEPVNSWLSLHPRFEILSPEQMDTLVGDATTIVHIGDNFPDEWKAWQDERRRKQRYLRNSSYSPKEDVGDYVRAAQLLDRRAEPGKVKILNALPNARKTFSLGRQLGRMQMDWTEVFAWQKLQDQLEALQSETSFQIEVATKEGFLNELRFGNSEYIVLAAHYDDGLVHFPDGSTLGHQELSAVTRENAPNRTLVFISCDAGVVNGPTASPSEMVLFNRLAQNVLAHPKPISAAHVPGMLRDFLINRKTIKESFSVLTPITFNLEVQPVKALKSGDHEPTNAS